MIKDKLLQKEYYIDKLSMFMRESYGIIPQIEIFVDWLNSMNATADVIASLLDIWNEDYLLSVKEICPNDEPFLPLDMIASLVGCSRRNVVMVPDTNNDPITYNKEILELNNEELLELIKVKIVQNNYDGSLKSIIDLYKNKLNYNIFYTLSKCEGTSRYAPASCNVFIDDQKTDGVTPVSENIKKIFKYSDFFIQSLGIVYDKKMISDIDTLLILDKDYTNEGEYAIYPDDYVQDENSIVLG